MKYRIFSKTGSYYGEYEGTDAAEALTAMAVSGAGDQSNAVDFMTVGTVVDWIIEEVSE